MQKPLIQSVLAMVALCVIMLAVRGAVDLFNDVLPPLPSCQKFGYLDYTTVVMNTKNHILMIQCVEEKTDEYKN